MSQERDLNIELLENDFIHHSSQITFFFFISYKRITRPSEYCYFLSLKNSFATLDLGSTSNCKLFIAMDIVEIGCAVLKCSKIGSVFPSFREGTQPLD